MASDGVRRRYSDWDWLREILVARYHGVAVPLLPEKRVVGNQNKNFIEERMQGLENWLLLVLSNPYLRSDVTLRMFLTQRGLPEFDQAKKAASSGVGADPSANPGLARWFGVLRHLTLPVDADAACSELSAHLEDSEARVVAALAAVTRYFEAAKLTTDSLRALRDALGDWHNSSASASASLSDTLAPVRTSLGVLASRLKKAGDAVANVYDLSVFAPNEIQIFLMDGLVTEIHRLRSLKALLAVRDAAQAAYSRAWVAQDKLHFQAKQFRDKGRNDKSDQLEPKIAEAVGLCKRMKERLDDVSKGVLHVEADRVSRARIDRALAMFGQYSALCIASGVRTQELWAGYLTANELDQAAMVADAQSTLTGQMSMHALDATGPSATLALPTSRLGPGGGTLRLPAGLAGAPKSSPSAASAGAGGTPDVAFAPPAFAAPAAPVFTPPPAPAAGGDYDPFSGGAPPAPAPAPVPAASTTAADLFPDDSASKEVSL